MLAECHYTHCNVGQLKAFPGTVIQRYSRQPDPLSKKLDQDRSRFTTQLAQQGPLCHVLELWMIRFEDVSFPLEATENQLLRIGSAIDSAFDFVLCCLDALTFVSICIPCFAVVYPFGAAGLAVRCPRRRWTKFVRCTFCENVEFLVFFRYFSEIL